ncbi:MAG: glutaryl-CoA dehydrogenase, partial [Frankiaceae bacterium]|nr:glutaryl-CoA dehydrogenase [Frankiaceae bacterium]
MSDHKPAEQPANQGSSSGVRTVAVLGAGLIGASWATLFAAHGLAVRLWDPRDVREEVRDSVHQFAATVPGGPYDPEVLLGRIEIVNDVATAVTGADLVQENGPERLAVKRELYATVESAVGPNVLICSSTSGIMPTDLAAEMAHPERLLVGHPFNPPHVIPLVELVPGEKTAAWAMEAAGAFYRGLGKSPVALHKEMPGFVANRLQSAVFKESVHLVLEGVVDQEELDTIMTESLGPRWATAGPFRSMHLGGGPGGLRHMLEHLGPGMQRRWKSLGQPELTPEVVEFLSSETEKRFAGQTYDALTQERDLAQLGVLAGREASADIAADGGIAPRSAEFYGREDLLETDRPALSQLLGDFYGYEEILSYQDQATLHRVREFMEAEVRPIANEQWAASEFPHHLIEKIGELGVVGLGYSDGGRTGRSRLLTGFMSLEMSRVDTSMATFFGVHSGLAMAAIVACASEEQKARWLPDMYALRKVGAFALTERDGGSDVAGHMATTARREGDEWVLNGHKRWIGNGTFADLVVVWARDESDDQVKGFVVETERGAGPEGFVTEKMAGKLTLRTVQNADIDLTDVRVPEANRLAHANSFKDTGRVLRLSRGGVAWNAVGCMMGAYESALAYAKQREQFGKPIAGFQLIQDHLVTMLGNVTSSLGMAVRTAQLQDQERCTDEQASLAKLFCTVRLREAVARGRELMGGNGM